MNWTLYRNGIRRSWKIFVIFAAVLTMYIVIIATMFDPELGSALDGIAEAMPELMAMVGMNNAGTSLVGFMSSYLYGFVMMIFPMVYSIIVANSLVAKQIDSGSMAYLLAAPVSRSKIIFTQMKVLGTGIFLLVAYGVVVGLISCEAYFPGELEIGKFLLLNVGALALQLFIGAICFCASSVFNDTKKSLAFGAGIPAFAYVVQMLANAGEELENAKYATFFTLFNPNGIVDGDGFALWSIGILAVGAAVLYVASMVVFIKKDIPV